MMRYARLTVLLVLVTSLLGACGSGGTPTGGPSRNALVVRMLYGSEKQAWIEAVTAAFNAQQIPSPSGKPIFIQAVPLGSGDALEQIVSGQEQPVIWSPASSLLLPLANERWAEQHPGTTFVDSTPPPLVLSPVVIAMWRPMAEALGWPEQPLGWQNLARLTSDGTTWATFDHPEWGPFQFGHTHPEYSNSGLTSILAMGYAAAGKTRGLTLADVAQPTVTQLIADVERGVIHYGESTGFFADQMFSRGPAYLSAAVLYENLVVQSYDTTRYPQRPLDVVAIYPEEGTFWSDHPFVIPAAPWVTDELRAAAITYREFLLARPQQAQAMEFGFRPADPAIPIGAPLTSEHGVDPEQPETLLEVPDAAVIAAVLTAWHEQKKPVSVEVVLDTSGSMQEERRLEQAKTALKVFVDQLADRDQLGVTVFNSTTTTLTPLTELGPKRQELARQLDGLFPAGGTRLIDTVSTVYQRMAAEPAGERIRALVVLSDGADTESSGSAAQLQQLLHTDEGGSSIKVFTIAYGTGSDVDTALMRTIAEASGATTYTSDPRSIEQVYRAIATFF